MNIVQCEQGSAEWFAARAGRVTASEVKQALSRYKLKSKVGESTVERDALMALLAGEILTGEPNMLGYKSAYMERGTDFEPDARRYYEARNKVMVETVGFVVHPAIDRSGASPDGLLGENGGLELKVPGMHTHVKYLLAQSLPELYAPQVHWSLACTGRDWWDFASYCPEMPERYRLFTIRVLRDEQMIATMEDGVREFLSDTDDLLARLAANFPELAAEVYDVGPQWDDSARLANAEIDAFFDDLPPAQEAI